MELRDATEDDLPQVVAILNDVIATSTAVFSDEPVTLEDRRRWRAERVARGYPVLVAADGDRVLGFGSFGEFRTSPSGYRFTVEHSLHVAREARGGGIGTALIEELLRRARALGKHVVVGAIDAANTGSLRLHERLGFERVAHLREVGFKAGQRLDLVLVQRILA